MLNHFGFKILLISNSPYCLLYNSYCVTLKEIGDGLTYNLLMNIICRYFFLQTHVNIFHLIAMYYCEFSITVYYNRIASYRGAVKKNIVLYLNHFSA